MGGEVPIEYYLNKTAPEPKDYMETFNIIAGAGGKKKISFKVDKINSIFRLDPLVNFKISHSHYGFTFFMLFEKMGIYDRRWRFGL